MKVFKKALMVVAGLVVLLFVTGECVRYAIHQKKTPSECEKQALQSAERECEKLRADDNAYSDCMLDRLKKGHQACD